ncbi:hypothetical protein D3C78_1179740 [compost metagenome]
MHQQHVTGQARRGGDRLLEIGQHIAGLFRVGVLDQERHGDFFFEADRREAAIGLRRDLGDDPAQVATVITGDVVPQHFHAVLRNRKSVVAVAGEIGQAVTVVDGRDVEGATLGRLVDFRRQAHASMGRVDRDLVGLRVALEHRDLSFGQLVLVLVHGRGGDGEQRFFIGEWVGQKALAVHGPGVFRNAAGPGRNRAIGIAGFFRAQRRQAGAQFVRFLRRDRRHHVHGQQAQGQGTALQDHLAHWVFLVSQIRSSRRSSTRESRGLRERCNRRQKSRCSSGWRCRCCGSRHRRRR